MRIINHRALNLTLTLTLLLHSPLFTRGELNSDRYLACGCTYAGTTARNLRNNLRCPDKQRRRSSAWWSASSRRSNPPRRSVSRDMCCSCSGSTVQTRGSYLVAKSRPSTSGQSRSRWPESSSEKLSLASSSSSSLRSVQLQVQCSTECSTSGRKTVYLMLFWTYTGRLNWKWSAGKTDDSPTCQLAFRQFADSPNDHKVFRMIS